jgi:hypothetical protein
VVGRHCHPIGVQDAGAPSQWFDAAAGGPATVASMFAVNVLVLTGRVHA